MKNYIKLFKLKRQIFKLDDLILTEKKYKEIVDYEWNYRDKPCIEFKIPKSKVEKLIPFKYVTYKSKDMLSNSTIFEADIRKVNQLSYNTANKLMRNFIYQFDELKLNNKLYFIEVYEESLLLIIDIFKNYHQYDKEKEVTKIVSYLLNQLPDETNTVEMEKIQHKKEVLDQRISFELEFLNKLNDINKGEGLD